MVSPNGISRQMKISREFVNPLGFSNGCAALALKNPPPLVPRSLMASIEATGPCATVWRPLVSVCTTEYPLKFWIAPLATSTSATTALMRQQDVKNPAHHVDPEASKRGHGSPRHGADHDDRHSHPHRRAEELMEHQADDLREVAHRGLAAVVLPVRVGGKAHGGVECQRCRHAGEVLRVEGEVILKAENEVRERDAHERHREDGHEIGDPALLVLLVDADRLVGEPLDRPDNPAGSRRARPCTP